MKLTKNIKIEIEKIKRNAAIDLLKTNVGKLMTIVFTKNDGDKRVCNGQFENKMNQLGYYTFKERCKEIKQFDPKKLIEIRVNKKIYQISK